MEGFEKKLKQSLQVTKSKYCIRITKFHLMKLLIYSGTVLISQDKINFERMCLSWDSNHRSPVIHTDALTN